MRNIITVNIGLNNNPYDFEALSAHMEDNFPTNFRSAKKVSKFKDQTEPTCVCEFEFFGEKEISEYLTNLCDALTQESITYAFMEVDGSIKHGHLAFNRGYEGEKYEFDEDLFLTLYRVVKEMTQEDILESLQKEFEETDQTHTNAMDEYGTFDEYTQFLGAYLSGLRKAIKIASGRKVD